MVIPSFERAPSLRDCLLRLAPGAQNISADQYEVIVTDDSHSKSVRELVEREFPWARWIQGPQRGPAANRNCGARSALGEWLVFTDDDCLPTPDWLLAFCKTIEGDSADLLEGRTACPDRTNAPREETIENLHGGNFWTCNLAVRRSAFTALGGFDEDFQEAAQEDAEFAARARAGGLRTGFVERALVHHPARRLTFSQLWKRALMVRWFSLYLLKTRRGWTDVNILRALALVCLERTANLLRENCRLAREYRPNTLARTCFVLAWNSLVFPILLPYVLWWEVRFRRSLSKNSRRTFSPVIHAVVKL